MNRQQSALSLLGSAARSREDASHNHALASASFATLPSLSNASFPQTLKPGWSSSTNPTSNIVSIEPGDKAANGSQQASLGVTRRGFLAKIAALAGVAEMVQRADAGLVKYSTFTNPVAYQQHLDLGNSFSNTVVHLTFDGAFRSSGVIVNNPRCILIACHQTENNGTFSNLDSHEYFVATGNNYLTNPGTNIRVSQIIRHPSRTTPGNGTDLAILILESDIPNSVPARIAATSPTQGNILQLIGYGKPGTMYGYQIPTGSIMGGEAPIHAIDQSIITTRFSDSSTNPIIFGGSPGDSGGGVFNLTRELVAIISQGTTSPASVTNTYSTNLTNPNNNNWIQEITTPYTLPAIPNMSIQFNQSNNEVILSVDRSLTSNGGSWLLEHSSNLTNWSTCPYQFSETTCIIPANNNQRLFFRLRWNPQQ